MKQRQVITLWRLLLGSLLCWLGSDVAHAHSTVQLKVTLRDNMGTAVADEPIQLQRFPMEENEAISCVTDEAGMCHWRVTRGLYQLSFIRPLDPISTLAVAEGGLSSLGLTVGDTDMTYHFTVQGDNHIYFDAAPEADIPSPIIPSRDILQGGIEEPTATLLDVVGVATTAEPTRIVSETAVSTDKSPVSPFLLPLLGGLLMGGLLFMWQRWQNQSPAPSSQPPIPSNSKESPDA